MPVLRVSSELLELDNRKWRDMKCRFDRQSFWTCQTTAFRELESIEVWVTHGREEALKHWRMTHQIKACELNLVGYEDEDD